MYCLPLALKLAVLCSAMPHLDGPRPIGSALVNDNVLYHAHISAKIKALLSIKTSAEAPI
jgi:hypothetical protein